MEPITYTLSEADIVAGNDLWRRSVTRARRLLLVALVLWLAYTALVTFDGPLTFASIAMSAAICGAVVVLIIAGIVIGTRWQSRRLALRYFRESRAAQQEVRASWTDTRLRLEQPDAYQDRPWSDWKKWSENDTLVVLTGSGPIFMALPKRVLSDAQISDIHACLSRAGVPQATLFPF